MRLRDMRLRTLLLGLLTACLLAPYASAEARPLPLERVEEDLAKLPFGKQLKDTVSWARMRLERELAPMVKRAIDDNERRRLRFGVQRDLQMLAKRVVKLEGPRTGFETSVVANEFVVNAGESLLSWKEGATTHYFFFLEDQLWKYARVLAAKQQPFTARVDGYAAELGKPHAGSSASSATWADASRRVRVNEHRKLFGADLFIVEDVALAAKHDKLGRMPTVGGIDDIDPEIRSLLLDPGDRVKDAPPVAPAEAKKDKKTKGKK